MKNFYERNDHVINSKVNVLFEELLENEKNGEKMMNDALFYTNNWWENKTFKFLIYTSPPNMK